MPGLLVCGIEDRDDIAPVRVAKVLSDALDLGILLLHVADAPPGLVPVWPDTGRAQHRTVTSAQVADGEQLLEEVASRHGLRPADRRVVAGRCAAELAASAVAERATLLVVGCRRTGVVRRALRGTVAQRLASGAPCPVVVAPPALGEGVDWPHKPPGGPVSEPNLVCGVDGSEIADRAVALATSLADGLRARVVLAHVLDPGADVVVGPDGPLSMDFSPLFDSDVCVGLKLLQELGALAISEGSELIVVGSRGRGALRSALLGSTSAKLAARAPVPVVIFPSALGRRNPGAGDELAWTA
jgi:nucleotide-binding universal stress UspA family protein